MIQVDLHTHTSKQTRIGMLCSPQELVQYKDSDGRVVGVYEKDNMSHVLSPIMKHSFICVANMSWLNCKYQSLSEDLTPFLLHIIILQKRE